MFREQYSLPSANSLTCPECGSTRFLVSGKKVACTNCGWKASGGDNKYGAKRTEFNGKQYDSKYEATVAEELDLRLKAKDILEVIPQYKIECYAYRKDGSKAFLVKHKVDFRIQLKDHSYELVEAKGQITTDYVWRRKFLELIWLPEHPDYTYRVVKQSDRGGWK